MNSVESVPSVPSAPSASSVESRGARLLGPGLRGPWTWQKAAAVPLLVLVRIYQLCVSPMLPPSCRFYPSCSAYAVTALVRFGPIKGTWLAARRLARCHPWNPGGVDHVPERVTTPAASAHPAASTTTVVKPKIGALASATNPVAESATTPARERAAT